MKPYNIAPRELEISEEIKFSAVSLGEKGRGRSLVHVPCPEEFKFLEPGLTRKGKPRLNRSESSKGWVARVSTEGAYIRGAYGHVSASPSSGVEVLARGRGAFGAAGQTGSWDDLVLVIPDGAVIRVKPSRGDAYYLLFGEAEVARFPKEEAEAFQDYLDIDLDGFQPL